MHVADTDQAMYVADTDTGAPKSLACLENPSFSLFLMPSPLRQGSLAAGTHRFMSQRPLSRGHLSLQQFY